MPVAVPMIRNALAVIAQKLIGITWRLQFALITGTVESTSLACTVLTVFVQKSARRELAFVNETWTLFLLDAFAIMLNHARLTETPLDTVDEVAVLTTRIV